MMAKAPVKIPWSVPVRHDDVPDTGLHLALAPDDATRAAIAALAGVRAVPQLAAIFDVTRHGRGLKVAGEVTAMVSQTCVVTLEPMTTELRESIDLVFVPPDPAPSQAMAEDVDPVAEEPELLVDGIADVGAAATEFLLLAIDPYPRKPDAVFEAPTHDDPGGHPFAALAALKGPANKT
jgi:hypothetical protein